VSDSYIVQAENLSVFFLDESLNFLRTEKQFESYGVFHSLRVFLNTLFKSIATFWEHYLWVEGKAPINSRVFILPESNKQDWFKNSPKSFQLVKIFPIGSSNI